MIANITFAIDLAKSHFDKALNFYYYFKQLLKYNVQIENNNVIDKFNSPFLINLLKASEMLGKLFNKNNVVIYEFKFYISCLNSIVSQFQKNILP